MECARASITPRVAEEIGRSDVLSFLRTGSVIVDARLRSAAGAIVAVAIIGSITRCDYASIRGSVELQSLINALWCSLNAVAN